MGELTGTRVAMLQRNAINESLGLCDLSAALRQLGAETRLFLSREERDLSRRLRDYAPRAVIVPCDLLGHNSALALARLAKEALGDRAVAILGGTHPTFFPNVVRQAGVDYAFAGEAEGVVADLLMALRDGRDPSAIPNLIVRDNGGFRRNPLRPVTQNLDDLPLPDRELYCRYPFMARFPAKKFATGRGCLNSCGYCFNPSYRALVGDPVHFFRRKSAARVAQEIQEVRRRYPLTIVHFSDDLFSSGEAWIEQFVAVYRARVGLPFSCNVMASAVTERVAGLLRDGGCRVVAVGIEAADERLRREVMNKPVSNDEIRRAAASIKRAGIKLVTFNIIGAPWSSADGDWETLELNQQIAADHNRVTPLVPFPVSRLTARLVAEGFLAADFEERIYETPDLPGWPATTLLPRAEPERLTRLYRLWPLLLRWRVQKKWARRLTGSRWSAALAPAAFALGLLAEKRIFGIGWLAGLRHFRHIGNPAAKTSNYLSFI